MAEWLRGRYDTKWSSLTGDNEGVVSTRFANAFFPELKESAALYRDVALALYRELSEFVHGNQISWRLTPSTLTHDLRLQNAWLEKLESAANVIIFSLCLRFTKELELNSIELLSPGVLDRLTHVEAIRAAFGGVTDPEL